LDVIQDLQNADKLRYIDQMVIEYHHHITKNQDNFSQLLRVLEEEGFGYQISSSSRLPIGPESYQDIGIYVYQKSALDKNF
jgi:hypothetical protein